MNVPDDLLAAAADVRGRLEEAAGAEVWPVVTDAAARRLARLLRLGAAVESCSRVPGESVVRDPLGRPVSSASTLLALLIEAGEGS